MVDGSDGAAATTTTPTTTTTTTTTTVADSSIGRWRWVVLGTASLNLLLHASINYNAGVIGVAVLEKFQADTVSVSWLMSFYSIMFALAAPVATIVINLTDCRTCVAVSGILGLVGYVSSGFVQSMPLLYVTLGLAGLGQTLCQSGAIMVLSYYFPLSLSVVHGVCLAGSGLGCFLHPVLSQLLFDSLGFRGAMMMLGAIAFHSLPLGLLLRPTDLEIRAKRGDKTTQYDRWKNIMAKIIPPAAIFKIPAFLMFVPAVFLNSVAFQTMVVTLPGYIKRHVGLTSQDGALAAMMFGGGSVTSRVLAGFAASDYRVGDAMMFLGMSAVLSVLSFSGGAILHLPHGPQLFSVFYGLYSGGAYNLACSLTVAIVGVERAPHGYGVIMVVFGLGGLVGSPILAWLVKLYGYQAMFVFCGTVSFLCAVFCAATSVLQSRSSSKGQGRQGHPFKKRDESIYIKSPDNNKYPGQKEGPDLLLDNTVDGKLTNDIDRTDTINSNPCDVDVEAYQSLLGDPNHV